MTYPAFFSFYGKEIARGHAVWRVYMELQPPALDFAEPKAVKISAVALELHMGRRHVAHAIDELVRAGYLLEHGRGARGVRKLRLAYALDPRRAA